VLNHSIKKPELSRGIAPHKGPINWDALRLIVDRAEGSALAKQLMGPRLLKAVRRHGIESLTPEWRYRYCGARLALGDFSDYWGWEFRGYSDADEGAGWAAAMYWEETWLPKWGGGYVDRLLVLGEQGVGDAVFFASILPECMTRVKTVVYECDDRLHTLLERSLPGLVCDKERPFEERRAGDAFIPAAELMRMFRRDRRHFPGKPYLRPDPARVAEFERFAGRDGVAWNARQGSLDPLKLELPHPVSLQYKTFHSEIEQPPVDLWADIEGIVALCSVLNRVVTVPTSVHHFAGALGKRVEIICPEVAGVENQIKWDHPLGMLPWYGNACVYRDITAWKAAQRERGAP